MSGGQLSLEDLGFGGGGDDLIGSSLSRVRVERRLGRGGMGEVYLGQASMGPRVIKVLAPEIASDPHLRARFQREWAALARIRSGEPPVAERFELFDRGIELANGYHELLEPDELRRRNAESNRLRRLDGKEPLPEDSRLLAAMRSGLPPSTGVALGFDRLVMLAAGAESIDQITAFPWDRA